MDVLTGDRILSIGGGGAEEAWRVLTPVLRAWAGNRVSLEDHPAGASGAGPA